MRNPLEDPVPEDPIQRVHALARDLAYGAAQNLWSSELGTIIVDVVQRLFVRHGDNKPLLNKWQGRYPFSSVLLSFGYIEETTRDQHEIYYILTSKAFDLLERPSPTSIFISYRRRESSALALLVLARFKAVGLEPFLDMSIQPGDDWHAQLESEVAGREYFVSLIGPTTLDSAYVRKEIRWAIESNAQIIPVWHNGFGETELTDFQQQYPKLEPFFSKNAILVEQENPVAYEGAIIQLFNRFGFTPA